MELCTTWMICQRTARRANQYMMRVSILNRLEATGMTLNYKKCRFGQSSLKLLDHVINTDGVNADPDRIDEILKLPVHKTQLQFLLGYIYQIGKFSPK